MLTQERLKELLHYDPETGVFRCCVSRGRSKGGESAGTNIGGYVVVQIDKRVFKAHRLAFLYVTGRWPGAEVDHINGLRADNRWVNLREATHSENQINSRGRGNPRGRRGVTRSGPKWKVQVGGLGYIGTYTCPLVAAWFYDIHALRLHGEFAVLNHPEWLECFQHECCHEDVRGD